MYKERKVSLKTNIPEVFVTLVVITFLSFNNYSCRSVFNSTQRKKEGTNPSATVKKDTVPATPSSFIAPGRDSTGTLSDSLSLLNDTVPGIRGDTLGKQATDTLDIKVSKDSLDAPVTYAALDSMVLDVPTKRIILYNEASTVYTDVDIKAYKIELDQQRKLVIATYGLDTAGKMTGQPVFVQKDTKMQMDSVVYNIETKKGITSSTYTNQGEIFVYGEKIKKISETDFYAKRGRFTTCNLDTPHFSFQTNKMKLVNKKFAITGPVHPEFEGVPIPVYLPFGFFPMSQGRHSGLLPPQFATNEQFGIGLEGLGYYKVLSDNLDVTFTTDIYSYGGYALNLLPTYRKRYRYAGQLALAFQNTRTLSNAGLKEFETARTFNISWAHTVDGKARPGTSFSANVRAGSTQFNRYVANNPIINFENQLSSSITYTKNWDNKYNISVGANHNQNNNTRLVSLNLPSVTFNVSNFYPLQPKELVGEPKWYEKLGVGLTSTVIGQSSFFDSLASVRQIVDTFEWGATHNIPITLALPQLGPLQIAPGVSYQERWYSKSTELSWNKGSKKLDTAVNKGFYTARDMSFSLSVSTAIFGIYNFGKKSSVKAIRHVIRPTASLNYKPDFSSQDYYDVQLEEDSLGRRGSFSRYQNSIGGAFGRGVFGGVSFGLDNNLEMKARAKSDTAAESDRKIKLLDGFGINGSYNLLADSFKLSTLNLYARSTLFDKVNITATALLDPYKVDSRGFSTKQYAWSGGKFSPGRITSGNIGISTSFQSKKKDESKKSASELQEEDDMPVTMDQQQNELDYIRNNPAEFTDFNIPWSLNVSYSLNFSRQNTPDYRGFETVISSNLSLNGDFNLTPKWKTGMNTYYDFRGSGIQSLTMFLSREMHCWQMSINVTPIGPYKTFSISINPKSALLRDLKINRRRSFNENL
ncbi:MAG: LPS-assembly protein LptD [Chitinophagaceae bacterium]|nr:LPS-assembly protein LptD [Chitinophagaceae bacterium]